MFKNIGSEHSFQGWEIFSHQWKMRAKMYAEISFILACLQFVIFLILCRVMIGSAGFELAWKYPFAKLATVFFMNPAISFGGGDISGVTFPAGEFSASALGNSGAVGNVVSRLYWRMYFAGILSCGVYFLLPVFVRWMYNRGEKALAVEHIRGMQLIQPEDLKKILSSKPGIIPLGPTKVPSDYEQEQILLAGKTRVGKTVATIQAIEAIRKANGKAIIHDFRGELTSRFFDESKDFIMNPLDARSTGWNIFDDVKSRMDISSICESLIPPSTGDDKFWCGAASNVLKGVMTWCYINNKRTNAELWKALTSPTAEIAKMCKATPAGAAGYKTIEDAAGKQAAGVIAVMMTYVSWLEFTGDSGGFSIDTWLANDEGGFIFLTGTAAVKETIKPLTGLFVELLGKKILDLDEDEKRRIYFILDEFGNMQKLPTLPDLLTGAGAKGAIFWVAIQDVARIQKVYGRELAETILNSCGTYLILKLKDPATAKVFSESMGQVQYWDANRSYRMSANDNSDVETVSRQRQTDWLVMPSEIMSLPKLHGYLMVPENNPAKIVLDIRPENRRAPQHPNFVLRPGYLLEDLVDMKDALWDDVEEWTDGQVKKEAEEELEFEIDEDSREDFTPKAKRNLGADLENEMI